MLKAQTADMPKGKQAKDRAHKLFRDEVYSFSGQKFETSCFVLLRQWYEAGIVVSVKTGHMLLSVQRLPSA